MVFFAVTETQLYIETFMMLISLSLSFPTCRFNFFTGCPKAKTCTLILRGGAEQFIEETERSLHDAIMIVRRAIKNDSVVAGREITILESLCKLM